MARPNERAVLKALERLERAARDYSRLWGEPVLTNERELKYKLACKKLRTAAVNYTRELDKSQRRRG